MQVPSASSKPHRRRVLLAGVGSAAALSLCVADMRVLPVSEREGERIGRFLIFWILNSAATLEIYRKIITALKILKIYV